MEKQDTSKIKLLLSVVIFGTIGICRRYIPLESSALAMLRGFIGMFSLLLIMKVRRKKISFRDIKGNLVLLVSSGTALGINWILLFEAYNYTTVAVATLCYYMAPIFIILASPVLFHETITRRKVICIFLAFVGMIFVSGVLNADNDTAGFRGILFGLGAAVFYAGVVILNKKLTHISSYDRTVVQLGVAGVVLLPYVLFTDAMKMGEMTYFVIIMILVVGVVHTGLAYALYFGSMKNLPAQTIAMFSYIDPIVAILISVFVLSEKMGLYEVIGIVCILGAAVINELPSPRGMSGRLESGRAGEP